MHKPEISLFHHPTTTVFVDDSEEFLYSIALGVDRLPYRSFSCPSQGLAYVNHFSSTYDVPSQSCPPSRSVSVSKLLARTEWKLGDHNRFAEPSVLVVDYSMPDMNGLDLCSEITNPNVKKVLLTGVADEKVAIDALNTELIDFYISKSENSLPHRLRDIISHLEIRYFQDLFGWGRDAEVRSELPHLFDPAFADYFEEAAEKLETVEYYPLAAPSGFRLINTYGHVSRMVVYSEDELDSALARSNLSHLPEKTRSLLEQRQLLPCAPLQSCTDAPVTEQQLVPATVIEGRQTYYCAVLETRHLPEELATNNTTYHQFLKTPPCFFRQEDTRQQQ